MLAASSAFGTKCLGEGLVAAEVTEGFGEVAGQGGQAEEGAGGDGRGDDVVGVEGDGGDVAGAEAGEGVGVHVAAGPDYEVAEEEEGGGRGEDGCGDTEG